MLAVAEEIEEDIEDETEATPLSEVFRWAEFQRRMAISRQQAREGKSRPAKEAIEDIIRKSYCLIASNSGGSRCA
jgi:hypothetical protein